MALIKLGLILIFSGIILNMFLVPKTYNFNINEILEIINEYEGIEYKGNEYKVIVIFLNYILNDLLQM